MAPWKLTPAAFERLLAALDPDRERAAAAYEGLRERIIGLFRWWGASRCEDLADETLDRAARKLDEGAIVPRGSLGPYFRGIARLVFYESTREPLTPIEDLDVATENDDRDDETALACLDRCLAAIDDAERSLVLRYYSGAKQSIARQALADELRITLRALRIRTHRVRARLEACVTACLETFSPNGHPFR